MLLAINANNTNVKFAVFDGDRLVNEWRIHTQAARTADEYAVWLTQLMALRSIEPRHIDGAIIASVVPQTLFDLRLLCRRYFNAEALVIGGDTLGAMQSGVYWGYVGLIEGLVRRIVAEWGAPMRVISTGGLAPLFADVTTVIERTAPDLTMRGLREIYRRSVKAGPK